MLRASRTTLTLHKPTRPFPLEEEAAEEAKEEAKVANPPGSVGIPFASGFKGRGLRVPKLGVPRTVEQHRNSDFDIVRVGAVGS